MKDDLLSKLVGGEEIGRVEISKVRSTTVTYVYIKSEPTLWTVGFYDPKGKFQPESDWPSTDEAAGRAHWLNGNEPYQQMEKKCTELENRLFAIEQKPAETEREWIRLNLTTEVWARKNDGGITRISFGAAINRNHLYTHIMPYHPGDKKPEPPVERGA